jgi:hypothetical protein
LIIGNCEEQYSPLILQCESYKGRVVVLCKNREAIIGELKYVVFLFLCVVNLRDGAMSTSLCNSFGLRDLCYQM